MVTSTTNQPGEYRAICLLKMEWQSFANPFKPRSAISNSRCFGMFCRRLQKSSVRCRSRSRWLSTEVFIWEVNQSSWLLNSHHSWEETTEVCFKSHQIQLLWKERKTFYWLLTCHYLTVAVIWQCCCLSISVSKSAPGLSESNINENPVSACCATVTVFYHFCNCSCW